MLGGMPLDPIVADVVVPVTPTQAFVGFTAQMGEWWDPLLTPEPATFTGIDIDPEGDVATVHGNERYVWGRVTAWEPAGRYAQELWLGHDEKQPSLLDVRFTEQDGGRTTAVHLEHGGWREDALAVRDRFGQWDALLSRYAAFVS